MSDTKNDKVKKKKHLRWTAQMDDVFIEAMVYQQWAENRPDGTFTSAAYAQMIKDVSEKIGIDLNKAHLKNCLKSLKTEFNEWFELFRNRLSSFAKSPNTKLWTTEPEVWKELIEVCFWIWLFIFLILNLIIVNAIFIYLFIFFVFRHILMQKNGRLNLFVTMIV